MAIYTGYWSAYYNNSKRAKSPSKVIAKSQKAQTKHKEITAEDISRFEAQDYIFQEVKGGKSVEVGN